MKITISIILWWDAFTAGTELARARGLYGAAMLPMPELEYTGSMKKLEQLDGRLQLRGESGARH